jgi:hypothetical protein
MALNHEKARVDGCSLVDLTTHLDKYPSVFSVSGNKLGSILWEELLIAFSAGLPFTSVNNSLYPLTKVSQRELMNSAPADVIHIMNEYFE